MKILLLSPNLESLPDPVFPLGLAYIAAVLKRNKVPYRVLDLCFVDDYEAAIKTSLAAFNPDIIGLSLRNVDNVSYPKYISYLSFYRQVVRTIRQHSRGLIVLGGSGFALIPEAILNYLGADYGFLGEAEFSLIKFIETIEQKKDPQSILNTRIIKCEPNPIASLDDLPLPERAEFDNTAYLKWGGMGNMQTKRGCPFKCIYCTYPVIEGKQIRIRQPKLVCDEIESLLEIGISHIFFVDNEFNHPIGHAKAICREIIDRKLPIQWSCYAHPRFVTPELVELMLSAGCTGLEFGSDAANDTMLINLGKNFRLKDLENASRICRQHDLPFCHSLLLGGPGETMETVGQTLTNMVAMAPTAVICMVGIRIFPATKLSQIAREENMVGSEENYLEPVFYISAAIKDRILPLIKNFSREHPTWIFPGLNININVKLQNKLRRFGVKGPLWEHMKIRKKGQKK